MYRVNIEVLYRTISSTTVVLCLLAFNNYKLNENVLSAPALEYESTLFPCNCFHYTSNLHWIQTFFKLCHFSVFKYYPIDSW